MNIISDSEPFIQNANVTSTEVPPGFDEWCGAVIVAIEISIRRESPCVCLAVSLLLVLAIRFY